MRCGRPCLDRGGSDRVAAGFLLCLRVVFVHIHWLRPRRSGFRWGFDERCCVRVTTALHSPCDSCSPDDPEGRVVRQTRRSESWTRGPDRETHRPELETLSSASSHPTTRQSLDPAPQNTPLQRAPDPWHH